MRGERKDDEWRMGGCKHCILVLDVEEKEGMTGSTWIPPAFLANLLHQPRLTVPSASTGSHAFWSPLGSASGKFWQETGGREERNGEYLVPQLPPQEVTSIWSYLSPCNGHWSYSHQFPWDSRSYFSSSPLHSPLLRAPGEPLFPRVPYIPPKSLYTVCLLSHPQIILISV